MPVQKDTYLQLSGFLKSKRVTLVAVSKTKPVADIEALYALGQRDFGENYVQELVEKQPLLPADIHWHFIGHLQSNKVKYIAPFVYMIHGVDSFKLLQTINRQGALYNRKIRCLLQVHIAVEESKFGLDKTELINLLKEVSGEHPLENVKICGLMGMASFSDDTKKVHGEFRVLKQLFDEVKEKFFDHDDLFSELSMGMSGDYGIAIEEGSTMVRIGSLLFGVR
jgi:pyridoxal phosphate enzyme (YggS family)